MTEGSTTPSEPKRKNQSVLKHAAVYGLGGIALQVAGFLLLPLYTHYLEPADFGVLDLIQRTSQIVLICLMVNGIRMATLTFYQQAETDEERDRIAVTQSALVVLMVLVFGTVIAIFSDSIAGWVGIDDPDLLTFGLIVSFLDATMIVPLALIQARLESALFVAVSISMLVLRVLLILLALVRLQWGVWGVFAASGVNAAIFGVSLTCREIMRGSLQIDLSKLPEIFRFTFPFLPGGILAFILMSSDRFFLNRMIGSAELGPYALAAKLAGVVALFSVTPLYRVWTSLMYKEAKKPNAPMVFGQMYSRIMTSFIVMGLLLCVFSKEVIFLFSSSDYARAATLIPLLVLAQYFFNGACVLDAAFYVTRKTGRKPWLTLVGAIFVLPALTYLIPKWGDLGAAMSLCIAFASLWMVTILTAQKTFPMLIDVPRQLGILVSAIGAFVIVATLDLSWTSFVAKILVVASWTSSIWFLGLIPKEDKAVFLNYLGRLNLTSNSSGSA